MSTWIASADSPTARAASSRSGGTTVAMLSGSPISAVCWRRSPTGFNRSSGSSSTCTRGAIADMTTSASSCLPIRLRSATGGSFPTPLPTCPRMFGYDQVIQPENHQKVRISQKTARKSPTASSSSCENALRPADAALLRRLKTPPRAAFGISWTSSRHPGGYVVSARTGVGAGWL